MEVDEENDEFENVNLIEDTAFYLREKIYRGDHEKLEEKCSNKSGDV